MEGSADDLGAPDSRESVDLDGSMRRLMVSLSHRTTGPSSLASTSAPDPPASGGLISEDNPRQGDQFRRDALEKRRERISKSRLMCGGGVHLQEDESRSAASISLNEDPSSVSDEDSESEESKGLGPDEALVGLGRGS